MTNRVICPACGKSNRLPDDFAGDTIVCLACGKRFEVTVPPAESNEAESQEQTPAAAAGEAAPDPDAIEMPAEEAKPAPARYPARRVQSREVAPSPAGRTALVAAVCLLAGGVVGTLITLALTARKAAPDATASADQPAVTRELLALKSQAEDLALQERLREAHAKYRELQDHAVGKIIKDPLFWDTMERAKVDQDRIYTLLLDKQDRGPANVGNSTTRPDDPWVISRERARAAGIGAASEPPAADTAPSTPADSANVVASDQPTREEAGNADPPAPGAAEPPATQDAVAQAGGSNASPEQPATSAPAESAGAGSASTPAPNSAAAEAPVPSAWVSDKDVTDEEVGFAIKRGVDYLLTQVKDGQLVPIADTTKIKHAGRNALVVYALLHAGAATRDPRLDPKGEFMGKMIEVMKKHDLDRDPADPQQPVTYARSLRAAALAFHNRPQDRDVLKEDAEWLIKAQVNGAYTYDDTFSEMDVPGAGASAPMELLPQWESTRRLLCDGLHDRNGREIKRPPARGGLGQSKMGTPSRSRLQLQRTAPPAPGTRRGPTPGPGMTSEPPMPPNPNARRVPIIPRRAPTPLPDGGMEFPWDNSNSQYGLLGVWAAAEVGIEVPNKYWEAVQKHWQTYQLRTGEWAYQAGDREGYLPMTCGGIASLWVTYDWLVSPKSKGQVGRPTTSDQLERGMKWLESADNATKTPIPGKTHYPGYDLFALERVGLASGFKYFGSHDWYRELAARSVASQFPSGAWGWEEVGHPDGLIETCYQLLFLSHGRHPIFMNKLRFANGKGEGVNGKPLPGYWANRPRDVANVTRFATRQFERQFNWQVVDLGREWFDWLDCPVLFIASHNAPGMSDADFDKLRQFTEAGGLLFTHADAGNAGFNHWVMEDLISKTFPGRKLETLPADHPLYSLNYDIKKNQPKLQGISNGSRLLLVHSPTDLGAAWQQRADRTQPAMFQIAANLFFYAAGTRDFRNRLDSPYVPPAKEGKSGTLAVARIKHSGDWDPEPGAWRRFANLYQWENDVNVPVSAVDFAALDSAKTPVAHLTGTQPVQFTEADAKALRAYVQSGGMVLVDPCGGSKAFNASVREGLLAKAFPGVSPTPVPKDHPLLTGAEATDTEPLPLRLRPYDVDKLKMTVPGLERIALGTGVVVLSSVDITTGLLGTNTVTVVGYDAPFAQAIVWNLLDWTEANLIAAGKMPAPK